MYCATFGTKGNLHTHNKSTVTEEVKQIAEKRKRHTLPLDQL